MIDKRMNNGLEGLIYPNMLEIYSQKSVSVWGNKGRQAEIPAAACLRVVGQVVALYGGETYICFLEKNFVEDKAMVLVTVEAAVDVRKLYLQEKVLGLLLANVEMHCHQMGTFVS